VFFIALLHHPTTCGSATPSNYGTNPRIQRWEIVARTNTIDTIELLYSYLAGMNDFAYTMHNVLCRSVTIEARYCLQSKQQARIGNRPLYPGVSPVVLRSGATPGGSG
jgi:hypothetical protein